MVEFANKESAKALGNPWANYPIASGTAGELHFERMHMLRKALRSISAQVH